MPGNHMKRLPLRLFVLGGLLALTSSCSLLTRTDEIHIVKDPGPAPAIQLPGDVTVQSLREGGATPLMAPRKGG